MNKFHQNLDIGSDSSIGSDTHKRRFFNKNSRRRRVPSNAQESPVVVLDAHHSRVETYDHNMHDNAGLDVQASRDNAAELVPLQQTRKMQKSKQKQRKVDAGGTAVAAQSQQMQTQAHALRHFESTLDLASSQVQRLFDDKDTTLLPLTTSKNKQNKNQQQLVTYRSAEASDVLWMKHLNEEYLPENYPIDFWRNTVKRWPGLSVVCESQGEIVGYVLGKIDIALNPRYATAQTQARRDKSKKMSSTKNKNNIKKIPKMLKEGKIISVCVQEGWRGKGVGKQLMNHMLNVFDHEYAADLVSLRVRKNTNPNAVALYSKLNFHVADSIPGYYKDGESALAMVANISNKI